MLKVTSIEFDCKRVTKNNAKKRKWTIIILLAYEHKKLLDMMFWTIKREKNQLTKERGKNHVDRTNVNFVKSIYAHFFVIIGILLYVILQQFHYFYYIKW